MRLARRSKTPHYNSALKRRNVYLSQQTRLILPAENVFGVIAIRNYTILNTYILHICY